MPTDIRYIKNGEALNEDVIARPMEDIEANLTEIFKAGIPKWYSGTTYEANSYARVGDDIYVAKRQNLNKAPTSNPNDWVLHEGNRQATASDRGTVTISDSTTSNSTITAASSKAAKTLQDDVNTRAYKATTIATGDGLNGGGNLGSNRTFSVDNSVLRDYHLQTDDYDDTNGRILTVGAFGLGSHTQYIGNASVTNNSIETGFYGYDTANGSSGGPVNVQRGSLIHQRRSSGGGETQLLVTEAATGNAQGVWRRWRTSGGWSSWIKGYDTSNSGAGSALDADLLDGEHGSFYQNASNLDAGTVPVARLSGKYNINISGNADNATEADKLDGEHGSFYRNAGNLNAGTIPHQRLPSATTFSIGAVERSSTAEALVGTPNKFPSADQVQEMFFQYGLGNNKTVVDQDLDKQMISGTYTFGVGAENTPVSGIAGSVFVGHWSSNAVVQICVAFFPTGSSGRMWTRARTDGSNGTWQPWREIYSSQHSGSGSGLDADKLDGQEGSFYRNASNINSGSISTARLPMGAGNGIDADKVDGLHAAQFIRSDVNDTFTGYLTGNSLALGGGVIRNSGAVLQVNGFQRTGKILLHEMDNNDVPIDSETTIENVGGELRWGNSRVWTQANDGAGSGLDADKLDGLDSSQFIRSDVNDTVSGVVNFDTRVEIGSWNGGLRFTEVRDSDNGIFIHGPEGGGDDLIKFTRNGKKDYDMFLSGSHLVWTDGNHGSGSGLDADKLDGQHGSFYRNAGNLNAGVISPARLPFSSNAEALAGNNNDTVMSPLRVHDSFNQFGLGVTSASYSSDVDNETTSGFWGWKEDSGNVPTGSAERGTGLTMVTAGGNRQTQIAIANEAFSEGMFYRVNRAGSWQPWRRVFHDGEMGSGSGLDADKVDGLQASQFIRSDADDTFTGYLTGNSLALGGSAIVSSGAVLQVNGFQRTGKILIHEMDNNDMPVGASATLENSGGFLKWSGSKVIREVDFATSANAKGGTNSDSVMTPLRTHEAMNWFGVGTSTSRQYTNFNSILDGGFYTAERDGQSPDNAPLSNDSTYAVIAASGFNANNMMQLAGVTSRTSVGNNDFYIRRRSQGGWDDWRTLWHDGNHGSGSGLDADKLDGQEGSFYRNAGNLNSGTISTNRLPLASTAAAEGGINSTDVMTAARTHEAFKQYGLGGRGGANDTASYGNDLDNIFDNRFDKYGTGVVNSPYGTAGTILTQHWNNEQRTQMAIAHFAGGRRGEMYTRAYQNNEWVEWRRHWDDKNHGSGSGLDADLLDGEEGSFFRNAGNLNAGTISSARLSGTYNINVSGNANTASNASDSDKLDGLNSSQFVRSDAINQKTGNNFHVDGSKLYFGTDKQHNLFDNDGAGQVGMQWNFDRNSLSQDGAAIEFEGWVDNATSPSWSIKTSSGGQLAGDTPDWAGGSILQGYGDGAIKWNGGHVWHEGNMGSGSGLDADKLDGLNSSQFIRSDTNDTFNGTITGHEMWLGGQAVMSSSGASLQVKGFSRMGSIYLHDGEEANGTGKKLENDGGVLEWDGAEVWHAGNDGAGSGLDADKLDGLNSSQFIRSDVNDVCSGKVLFGGDGSSSGAAAIAIAIGDSDTGFSWVSDGRYRLRANSQTVAEVNTGELDVLKPLRQNGNQVWHAGNDGDGSGLDADKLDGQHGSFYRNAGNLNAGTVNLNRLPTGLLMPEGDGSWIIFPMANSTEKQVMMWGTAGNVTDGTWITYPMAMKNVQTFVHGRDQDTISLNNNELISVANVSNTGFRVRKANESNGNTLLRYMVVGRID